MIKLQGHLTVTLPLSTHNSQFTAPSAAFLTPIILHSSQSTSISGTTAKRAHLATLNLDQEAPVGLMANNLVGTEEMKNRIIRNNRQ